jgi:hypothetical protein
VELCIVHTLGLPVARTEHGLAMQSLVLACSPKDTEAYERIGDAALYSGGGGVMAPVCLAQRCGSEGAQDSLHLTNSRGLLLWGAE